MSMPHFLTALFAPEPSPDEILRGEVLKAAIERAIEKTDHRLKALDDCHKRLHGPVETALNHMLGLVQGLPAPVQISPSRYAHDPRLRAVFASPEHMRDILGRFATVKDYLANLEGLPPDAVFGLLSAAPREKRMLGMELDGDRVTRDVLQTVIVFEDHQYLAPSDSEAAARTALTTLGFDFLLRQARETLVAQKTRRGELARQRQILKRRLLSPISDPGHPLDPGTLEAEIAQIDEELGFFSGIELSLGDSLGLIAKVLEEAGQRLSVKPYRVSLDYRNVIVQASERLEMIEVSTLDGSKRIVLFGHLPRHELPEPKDMLRLAQAYLG